MTDLDQLEALLAKATPGTDWLAHEYSNSSGKGPVMLWDSPYRRNACIECVPRDLAPLLVVLLNKAPALIAKARRVEALEASLKATAEVAATHLKTVSALRRRVAVLERTLKLASGWIGRQRHSKSGAEIFGKIGQIIMDDPAARAALKENTDADL